MTVFIRGIVFFSLMPSMFYASSFFKLATYESVRHLRVSVAKAENLRAVRATESYAIGCAQDEGEERINKQIEQVQRTMFEQSGLAVLCDVAIAVREKRDKVPSAKQTRVPAAPKHKKDYTPTFQLVLYNSFSALSSTEDDEE